MRLLPRSSRPLRFCDAPITGTLTLPNEPPRPKANPEAISGPSTMTTSPSASASIAKLLRQPAPLGPAHPHTLPPAQVPALMSPLELAHLLHRRQALYLGLPRAPHLDQPIAPGPEADRTGPPTSTTIRMIAREPRL